MKIIMFICLLTLSCVPAMDSANNPDLFINLRNKSSQDIVVYDKFNKPEDTSLSFVERRITLTNAINVIKSKDSFVIPLESVTFKRLPDHVWMVYLFSKETLDNTPLEDIVANEMVLKRYAFTLEDLEAMNFEIIYTGD